MIDPHEPRIDIPLDNGFSLALTGHEGTFGLRILKENPNGSKTFVTPNTALSEHDLTSIGHLLRVFAASHRGQAYWFSDEPREGPQLAQALTAILG